MTPVTDPANEAAATLRRLAGRLLEVAELGPVDMAAALGEMLPTTAEDGLLVEASTARRLAMAAVCVREGGVNAGARKLGMDTGNLSRMLKQAGLSSLVPLAERGRR